MPGFPRILFYAPGSGYSPKGFAPTPLRVSFDAGAHCGTAYQDVPSVAGGVRKSKAGKYISCHLHHAATLRIGPNPMNVYRCDDFDGTNNQHALDAAEQYEFRLLRRTRCLAGDPEVYGTVYIGTGSSGYLVGTMDLWMRFRD